MPTLYPSGLDAPSNPTQTTSMAGSGFEHDLQHININDAMRAVQVYVGTTGSLVPGTITSTLNNAVGNITILQGNISTINGQLLIANANITANTNNIVSNTASIASLTSTKVNLAGGRMSGQLGIFYQPAAPSAALYASAQLLISNTLTADNPPSIGFQAVNALGLALYVNVNGLNCITNTGGTSVVINNQGQLNPLSIANGTLPSAKLVASSITSAQLATNSVTNPQIASGAVDVTKFDSTVMPAIQAAVGCPVGTILPFAGLTSDSYANYGLPTGWLPCHGLAVSRTTYAALFAVISTWYGAGNGSTTFNLPDLVSRVPVGTFLTSSNTAWYGGSVGIATSLGAKGGEWYHTLSAAEMPVHSHGVNDPGHNHGVNDPTHAHGIADPGHAHGVSDPGHAHYIGAVPTTFAGTSGGYDAIVWAGQFGYSVADQAAVTHIGIYGAGTGIGIYGAYTGVSIAAHGTGIYLSNAGSGGQHNNMQPFQGITYMIKY